MQMTGQQRIEAKRAQVWAALNDPAVLKQCIPGCQSLEQAADGKLNAIVNLKVGPISARFAGAVLLSDLKPPNSYTITGEGQGGAAGFAKGSAKVTLAEAGEATLLSYEVEAQVGGRLAQLGGPVIDAAAKQLAGGFFKRLGDAMAPASAAATASEPPPARALTQPSYYWPIVLALVVAALVGFALGASVETAQSISIGVSLCALIVAAASAGFALGRGKANPPQSEGP